MLTEHLKVFLTYGYVIDTFQADIQYDRTSLSETHNEQVYTYFSYIVVLRHCHTFE